MTQNNHAAHVYTRRNFIQLMGIAGLTTLGLGACAPDSTSSSSSSDSGSSATQVSVLVYNANPPYCYLDDSGNIAGYDVDVLKAVDERLEDYDFNMDSMDFAAMITACESGSAELVSCQLVPNEERKSKFIFCEEPFCLSPLVFATADPSIKT